MLVKFTEFSKFSFFNPEMQVKPEMEDYYTIQTPGHHSTMFAELHVLQKQGVMCDVILAAEDGEVMAHKVVLMAASKYFRDKLSPVMGPTASKICLKGISVVELANLVKYIYTGKLLVAKETMDITLEISEILELHGVIQGYKEIISYEQMKGDPTTSADLKSDPLSIPAAIPPGITSKSSGETSAPQSTNVQVPKSADQVTIGPGQPAVTNVPKLALSSSGTQPVANNGTTISSTSEAPQPDSNQSTKVVVTEQCEDGSTVTYHVESSGEPSDANTTQGSSNDFNFDSLYDQQYMDVSAGSRTPAKNPGISTPQTIVTPPKLQQMAPLPTESQKMAEERAQHQDLLAVAIETLSDVPHLKQNPHLTQPEVDRAVSSIAGNDTNQIVAQNVIGVKPEDDLEDFENGKTNTKTVTMSAGTVNNELGGKTDVYTVALDPATVKSPLKMARPRKIKSAKEKEAEEKAKKYRQKKAELIAGGTTDNKPTPVNDLEPRRGLRSKSSTIKQDFQYESLSKTKKKTFSPRILLIKKNSEMDHISGVDMKDEGYDDENSKVTPEVVRMKAPKEEKKDTVGDDFGQVVNFDSDSDEADDVDGMIVNDILAAIDDGQSKSEETRKTEEKACKTKADIIKADGSEPKGKREKDRVKNQNAKEIEMSTKKVESNKKEEKNKNDKNLKTKSSSNISDVTENMDRIKNPKAKEIEMSNTKVVSNKKEEKNKNDLKNKSSSNVSDVTENMGRKEDEDKVNNEKTPSKIKTIENKNGVQDLHDNADDEKELPDDLQMQNIDEEKMRSSATKRKTRTPRKLPLSDEEKGNESGPDRHDKIPVVRSRRRSRSLNLDKEKEHKIAKTDSCLEKDVDNRSEAKNKKRSKTNFDEENNKCSDKDLSKSSSRNPDKEKQNKLDKTEHSSKSNFGNNNEAKNKKSYFDEISINCKDKDLSKPTEIKIIAQSQVDEKALGEAEKQIQDSESKKIIVVPKNYQPEIRLKKRTTEEMLQLAKELPVSPRKVASDEIELEMEAYETGEGDDDDDYDDMSADDGTKGSVVNAMDEKEKKTLEIVGKRKNEESVKSSAKKKRTTGPEACSSSQVSESGQNPLKTEINNDSSTIKTIGQIRGNIFDIMKDNPESSMLMIDSCQIVGSSNSKTGSKDILATKRKERGKNVEKEVGKAVKEKREGVHSKTDVEVKSVKEKAKRTINIMDGVKAVKEKDKETSSKDVGKGKKGEAGNSNVRVDDSVEVREESTSTEYLAEDEELDETDEEAGELGDSMVYVCSEDNCVFSSKSSASLHQHQSMFHDSSPSGVEKKTSSRPGGKKTARTGTASQPHCFECGKNFKTTKIMKKHMEYTHSARKSLKCGHCDFSTPFKSSMSTHLKLKHTVKRAMFMCKYCSYGTPLTGNLRKHLFSTHGLIIVTKQHRRTTEYEKFEEGTIVTKDGLIFDPETMELPKATKRKIKQEFDENEPVESKAESKVENKKRTRISLSKLPVEDFLKEMMKRHEDYINKPEKKYSFMSSSIAMATQNPSFPQASPQVRNTRANKIYNMKKLKPTFTDQNSGAYGIGNLHGMYQSGASVPQVASEVEVELHNQPVVVLENVEGDPPTTVLTISEHKGTDGAEMIVINQNGKQTVVRSKDFYDTLQATGHDTSQTLGVISALLQAGEQIEIREQEEIVEIQNI